MKLSLDEFSVIVKQVLENEFQTAFDKDVLYNFKFNGAQSIGFHYSNLNSKVFVSILDYKDLVRINSYLLDFLSRAKLITENVTKTNSTFCLVLPANVEDSIYSEITNSLVNNELMNYRFYKFADIIELYESNLKSVSFSFDKAIKKFEKLNSQIFVGGHSWEQGDQLDHFIKESRWENGREDRNTQAVNSATVGDLVLMKSTYAEKGESYLRIKAIGVVNNNKLDGHNLGVNWIVLKNVINIPGLGKLRNTFQLLRSKDYPVLFQEIISKHPNLFEQIEQLIIMVRSNIYGNKKTNSSKNLWWLRNNFLSLRFETLETSKKHEYVFSDESIQKVINKNLKTIQKGDLFIAYEGNEEGKVFHILKAESILNNKSLSILKYSILLKFPTPINWDEIIELKELNDSEIKTDLVSELHSLNEKEFTAILRLRNFDYNLIPELKDLIPETKSEDDTIDNEGSEGEHDKVIYGKDRIPFHLDQVTKEDQLGREPVAKALADLLLNDIFTKELNHSFMIHLQGEWGSGKSSFLNLVTKHLDSENKKWLVVNYNAWENQHIQPPWWTFINTIYQQAKIDLKGTSKCDLILREACRRTIWYTGWKKIVAFLATVFFIVFLISNWSSLSEYGANLPTPNNVSNTQNGLGIEIMAKMILALSSIVGVFYSLSKFFTNSLFMNSTDQAISFVKRSKDPMSQIKKHFNEMVDDILKEKELAIYIDDIDRCNKEYVVELMEGIQTLFKGKRCLYIIAGDKRWITKSFGNTYQEFKNENESTEELGDLFLEKAFQLSVRLPEGTKETKKTYWAHILELKEENDNNSKRDNIDLLTENEKNQIEIDLNRNQDRWIDPEYLMSLEKAYNLTGDTVSNIVIKKSNENTEELRHLLVDFHDIIDSNPRKVKRLANNYTMTRSTLQAERRKFEPEKLFRWLAIANQFPKFEDYVFKNLILEVPNEDDFNKMVPKEKVESFYALLKDSDELFGGEILIADVLNMLGKN